MKTNAAAKCFRFAVCYLAAVLRAFGAMHHDVDFGVGSGPSDVSCHNLDVVHDTYRVQLHVGLSVTLSVGHFGSQHTYSPAGLNRQQIKQISTLIV